MANLTGTSLEEGQSINRPPLFNGINYNYWKNRMKIYVQSVDYELWRIIMNGPKIPTKRINTVEVAKSESEWNDDDLKIMQANAKAINVLYYALDTLEFNRISSCESAKEIWNKLELTYEGTNQVDESKKNFLIHDYEMFEMKPEESISEMLSRFTDIINGLKCLGKVYSNNEQVRKVLKSLPKNWEAKVAEIQEVKNLDSLSLEELLDPLMTNELTQSQNAQEEDDQKKERVIAFESSTLENDQGSTEEKNAEPDLVTKNCKKFMKKKRRKGESHRKSSNSKCNKHGHFKPEYPQLKRRRKRSKEAVAVPTILSGREESSSNEKSDIEERADMCLMTQEEDTNEVSTSEFTFDELLDAFHELMNEFRKLGAKNNVLKKMVSSLTKGNEVLKSENETLKKENEILKEKVKDLDTSLVSFVKEKENLNTFVEKQKCICGKASSGYNPFKNKKVFKNQLNASFRRTEIRCFYCQKKGHKADQCFLMNKSQMIKKIFVPKGTLNTNPQGPNMMWVPKSKT